MNCAYSTNAGAKRKINQDALLAATINQNGKLYYIFAAADGLGGHRSGEVASQAAIDYIANNLRDVDNYFDFHEMDRFINRVNSDIIKKSVHNPNLSGMATTLTLCILDNQNLSISQIGDSRAYRINDDGIKQLTKDHSLVQMLVDEGRISEEEARLHPQKNVITKALGTDSKVNIDLFNYTISADDTFLVCSDGLYNMVSEEEIFTIIRKNSPKQAVKKLINLANKNGGTDNITVLVFSNEEAGSD